MRAIDYSDSKEISQEASLPHSLLGSLNFVNSIFINLELQVPYQAVPSAGLDILYENRLGGLLQEIDLLVDLVLFKGGHIKVLEALSEVFSEPLIHGLYACLDPVSVPKSKSLYLLVFLDDHEGVCEGTYFADLRKVDVVSLRPFFHAHIFRVVFAHVSASEHGAPIGSEQRSSCVFRLIVLLHGF